MPSRLSKNRLSAHGDSDGIPETLDSTGTAFGFDGLQRAVEAPGSAQQIHDTILERLEAFAGDAPVVDDRSLVVIRRDGSEHFPDKN